jgi:cytochrome P450
MPNPTDLTPVSAVTAADPYPFYAALVADRPFGWDDRLGVWVAASAAAVTAVLGEPGLRVRPPSEPVPAGLVATAAGDVFGRLIRMTDGSAQRRLKDVVIAALRRPRAEEVSALAAGRTAYTLKQAGGMPLRELMFAVPAQVVAVLSGLDDPAADEASRLIAEFVQCIPASATPAQQASAARAAAALQELLGPSLDQRGSGLLGELVRATQAAQAEALGGSVDSVGSVESASLLANGIGLLSQTYDATAGLIGNTLISLGRRLAPVPSEPEGWRDLVHEVARFDAPVQNTRRFAAAPTSIAGIRVDVGDPVLVLLAAANRDPAANPEPEMFRLERKDAAIFTFGSAAHRCPGQELAVAIAAAVVAELFAQGFDSSALPAPVAYLPLANARIPVL